MKMTLTAVLAAGAFGLGACATAVPRDLVNARRAYADATKGPARELAPVQLREAQKALDRANYEYGERPTSGEVKDYSYIALRKTQTAESVARQELAKQQKLNAETGLQAARLQKQNMTEAELRQMQARLAEEQRARELQQRDLSQSQAQLEAERQARADAERKIAEAEARANEAAESLKKIAAVREDERGLVVTLSGSLLFASGRADLLPSARRKLDEIAAALEKAKSQSLVVEGHTDSQGSDSFNETLSFRRAEAVREYLASRGIPSERIRAKGLGETQPVAENSSAEGRANNRRVEIVLERSKSSATGVGGSGSEAPPAVPND